MSGLTYVVLRCLLLSVLLQVTVGTFVHDAVHLTDVAGQVLAQAGQVSCERDVTLPDDHDSTEMCPWCMATVKSCQMFAAVAIPHFYATGFSVVSPVRQHTAHTGVAHWRFSVRDPPGGFA